VEAQTSASLIPAQKWNHSDRVTSIGSIVLLGHKKDWQQCPLLHNLNFRHIQSKQTTNGQGQGGY
jgi:hypothetical protein